MGIESGVQSGVVRFSQSDYKLGGHYDVRFFQGDTRNIQGRVCRGLKNVAHETYVQCALEPALISSPIEVWKDAKEVAEFNNEMIPGMEVMFDRNNGRFQKSNRQNLWRPPA